MDALTLLLYATHSPEVCIGDQDDDSWHARCLQKHSDAANSEFERRNMRVYLNRCELRKPRRFQNCWGCGGSLKKVPVWTP